MPSSPRRSSLISPGCPDRTSRPTRQHGSRRRPGSKASPAASSSIATPSRQRRTRPTLSAATACGTTARGSSGFLHEEMAQIRKRPPVLPVAHRSPTRLRARCPTMAGVSSVPLKRSIGTRSGSDRGTLSDSRDGYGRLLRAISPRLVARCMEPGERSPAHASGRWSEPAAPYHLRSRRRRSGSSSESDCRARPSG